MGSSPIRLVSGDNMDELTEDMLKSNYEYLTRQTTEKHLQAARVENSRDEALKAWQAKCSHIFGDPLSVYGYGLVYTCIKCKLDLVK